jgi:hypothetical protein
LNARRTLGYSSLRFLALGDFEMTPRFTIPFAIFTGLLLMPAPGQSAGFPAGLIGKTVNVNWTADRLQTFEGETTPVSRSISYGLSIYISTAGRAFSKLRASTSGPGRRAGFRMRSGESEQAPDESRSSTGGNRVVRFASGELTVDHVWISGVVHVAAAFDAGFGSCTARVINGREGGAAMRGRSIISGRKFVVHSVQASTPSCSVASGNALAGQ